MRAVNTSAQPVYQDDLVTLYQGDMRDVLTQIDCSEVGLVLADPPYGQTSLRWDQWPDGWPWEVARCVPMSASLWCFGSLRMFMEHADEFTKWAMAQDIVWEKHNGSSFHADCFRRVHEQAVQFYRGPWGDIWQDVPTTDDAVKRQVRRKERPTHMGAIEDSTYTSVDGGPKLMRSVIYVRSEHGRAVHPTQKPEGILEPLIRSSCRPGAVVLDPFAGSGSTLLTARKLGLRSIGIEQSPDYCQVIIDRLAQGLLIQSGTSGSQQVTP